MPTIDPVAAAIEAVAAHLEAELVPDTLSSVIRGWPEDGWELDLSGKPVVSVTAGGEERTDCPARSLGTSESGGVVTHTYRRGYLVIVAQVDLWAPYRATTDDVAPLIMDALTEAPPMPTRLRLTSTGYHNRPLVCHLGPQGRDVDGDSAKKGEWRMTWPLRIETDIVSTVAHVPIARVDLDVTTTVGTVEVAETVTVTGA